MYMPRAFREDRTDVLLAAMRGIGSAAVVSDGPDGLLASHVPIEVDPEPAHWGTIRCHFARPNPQVKAIVEGRDLLFIFQGPQAYVSPYWYPTKRRTGKVVPTLNYVAIHAYGTVSGFLDGDGLRAHLAALTDRFEASNDPPWKIGDAPAEYIDAMCRAITSIRVPLTRIEGKWKLSQNRDRGDRLGVVKGLRERGDAASLALADLVEEAIGDEGDRWAGPFQWSLRRGM